MAGKLSACLVGKKTVMTKFTLLPKQKFQYSTTAVLKKAGLKNCAYCQSSGCSKSFRRVSFGNSFRLPEKRMKLRTCRNWSYSWCQCVFALLLLCQLRQQMVPPTVDANCHLTDYLCLKKKLQTVQILVFRRS